MFPSANRLLKHNVLLNIFLLILVVTVFLFKQRKETDILSNSEEILSRNPQKSLEKRKTTQKRDELKADQTPLKEIQSKNFTVKIQILAYKRGGSSFIGELFENNPDAWYYFEPLAFWSSNILPQNYKYSWSEATRSSYEDVREKYQQYVPYLNNILSCNFSDEVFQYYQMGAAGRKYADVRETYFNPRLFVQKSPKLKASMKLDASSKDFLGEMCSNYPVRVAKTVRLIHAEALRQFLDKNVFVIHVVRDPRAVAVSRRANTPSYRSLDVSHTNPKYFCRSIAENIRIVSEAEATGNRRWINLRYEDLARNPMTEAKKLYSQLGLTFPDILESWIMENTMSNKHHFEMSGKGINLGTRRNSTEAAEHWIRDIDPKIARMFDENKYCQYVYKRMGYKIYQELQ